MNKNMKITIYGDSISTVNYGSGGYEKALQHKFDAYISNYAKSSSCLTALMENCGINIFKANLPQTDTNFVIVWYGSNDWYWGAPIGNVYTKSTKTFLGSLNTIIANIRKNAPKAKIVWLSPIYRFEACDESMQESEAFFTQNKVGNTLFDYYNAIFEGCNINGVDVLDMHKLCNINASNANVFLQDKVHPSQEGYKVISRTIIDYIQQNKEDL